MIVPLHPFKVFRLRVDMCADCGEPRAKHQAPQVTPVVKTECRCVPPLLFWGDCSRHGAPWRLAQSREAK